jgi:class 3 adenylate cyclase/pimeloyl-ACP methyl ester carboxylesterase
MTEPEYRFCKSADGTEIGYVKLGEGPPLLATWPCTGEFEVAWSFQSGREWISAFARDHTYITVDRRGTGLSQREVGELSMEADTADLEAVVEAEGLEKFNMVSAYEASSVAVNYAVAHPEHVGKIALIGPYARGADFRSPESVKALTDLIRGPGWSIARRSVADVLLPSGPAEVARSYVQLAKQTCSPDVFATYVERESTLDVTALVPQMPAPCLVVHRKDSRLVPVSAVRAFASQLSSGKLVLISGDQSVPYVDVPRIANPIIEFLGGTPEPSGPAPERRGTVATILFTDLVGHTEMMSRLGDERGRELLREHERVTREVLAAHGGTEVKTMGDGFMASFGSVTKAVECAITLQKAFADWNANVGAQGLAPLSIRVGLNAGEPIEEDGDLFGATVILASRIAAKADGGEILVADTVRGLCSGKGFLFSDRGEFVAKGFEEPVRVYEVSWQGQ